MIFPLGESREVVEPPDSKRAVASLTVPETLGDAGLIVTFRVIGDPVTSILEVSGEGLGDTSEELLVRNDAEESMLSKSGYNVWRKS